MEKDTLVKAQQINEEINEIKNTIGRISYHHMHADRKQSYKKYNWMMRFLNKRNENGITEPKIFLFDNDNMHGSDVPVDEGLLITIKEYFEIKLKEKEQQFNELN